MLQQLKHLAARHLPNRLQFRLRQLARPFGRPEPELALVAALARTDRAFLDVGANKGLYIEAALGRFAQVFAIEPNPAMAAYLRDCFGERCQILPLALSDREGTLQLYVPRRGQQAIASRGSLEPEANQGLEQTSIPVRVTRLDGLTLPPLGLVKIDVEGHEQAVLEGGRGRWASDRPPLLIEIEERHHPGRSDAVVGLLAELGYAACYLEGGRLRWLDGTPVAALQAAADAYVNNFLFLHREDETARAALRAAALLA